MADPELPARGEEGPVARPEDPRTRDELAVADEPGGLLGLLLWPLRAAISLGLRVFAAFVSGVLGAIFPALRKPPEPPEPPPPSLDDPGRRG